MKPTVWRDAIRDSNLDRTAKLVAFVLSTYMNGAGVAFPAKDTIAEGAGLGRGRRSVDTAVDRIEAEGFLEVKRSKGRRSFNYRATTPNVAPDAPLNLAARATFGNANVASDDSQRRTKRQPTSHGVRSNVARAATESGTESERSRVEGARPGHDSEEEQPEIENPASDSAESCAWEESLESPYEITRAESGEMESLAEEAHSVLESIRLRSREQPT